MLDRLVERGSFSSRRSIIQEAVEEKLKRLDKARLAKECAKLDPEFEKSLAEEGMVAAVRQSPH
jgi:Arc/MetJ-type ribon-helix-helix transcriptional regulator